VKVERFGLEFEFVGLPRTTAAEVVANVLRVDHVHNIEKRTRTCVGCGQIITRKEQHSAWSVIDDSTLLQSAVDKTTTGEVVSPPLTSLDLGDACRVASALAEAGAKTDNRTGFHVHLEVAHLTFAERADIARNWFKGEPTMMARVARHRLLEAECETYLIHHFEKDRIITALLDEENCAKHLEIVTRRRRSLNFLAYPRYGTFEVRLHEGTLNPEAIIAWVSRLLRLFNKEEEAA